MVVVPTLNLEGTRAFLEQCLRIISQRGPASKFIKFLIVSRRFLICSSFKPFGIYRFVLHDAVDNHLMFSFSLRKFDYSGEKYCVSRPLRSFYLSVDKASTLTQLLRPSIVEIDIKGKKLPDKCTAYIDLLSQTSEKLAFHFDYMFEEIIPVLEKCYPRIVEFGIFSGNHVPRQLAGKLTPAIYYLYNLGQIDQLAGVLCANRMEELNVTFHVYGYDDPHFIDNIRDLAANKNNSICPTLRKISFRISSGRMFDWTHLISFVKSISPNLNCISIFNDHNVVSTTVLSSSEVVDAILDYHSVLCNLEEQCSQLFAKASINFRLDLRFDTSTTNRDWMEALKKRFVIEKTITAGRNYTFLTLKTKKSICSLSFMVDIFENF